MLAEGFLRNGRQCGCPVEMHAEILKGAWRILSRAPAEPRRCDTKREKLMGFNVPAVSLKFHFGSLVLHRWPWSVAMNKESDFLKKINFLCFVMVFTSIIRSSWKLLEYSSDWLSDSTCRGTSMRWICAELETSAYETKWDAMTPWGVPSFTLIVLEAEVDINSTNEKTLHYYHVAHLCTWYTNWTFVKQRYEMLYAALCLLPCYQSTRSYQHLSCTQGHWVLPPVPAVSGWSGVTPWTRHHFIFPATVCLKTPTEIRCQKPCVGIRHKAALFL